MELYIVSLDIWKQMFLRLILLLEDQQMTLGENVTQYPFLFLELGFQVLAALVTLQCLLI